MHHKPLLFAALATLAIGAIPPVAAAGAAAGSDEAITSNVQAALAADRRLQVKTPIEVVTRDGVVSLSGDVASASMVYRAVETASKIDGVKQVDTHHLDTP